MQYDDEIKFERHFNSDEIFNESVEPTYGKNAVLFLLELSKVLLKDKRARQFPDLITFAYFCRKSNLQAFKTSHLDDSIEMNRFGWGVCLHIAPANIPMNFAFSFIMGFLSGNKNIVRLPSKKFEQIDIFLELFSSVMLRDNFKELKKKNYFIRTQRDSNKLLNLISHVDALIVWGGDSTVNKFRNVRKKPSCIEAYFPDRVSSLLINCDKLLGLSLIEMKKICSEFFNDTYLVDQNACSSASMICWYSRKNNFLKAKDYFTKSMLAHLQDSYQLETISRIEKTIDVVKFCESTNGIVEIEKPGDKLWYVHSEEHKLIKPKLGVFISKELDNLNQLEPLFRSNEQTLTYFGFNPQEIISEFAGKSSSMIDRVVPIGKALDIGLIWDGKNMIYALSKYVNTV